MRILDSVDVRDAGFRKCRAGLFATLVGPLHDRVEPLAVILLFGLGMVTVTLYFAVGSRQTEPGDGLH